jgi:hypothetical protein
LQDLRFSWRCLWRIISSGMWCHVGLVNLSATTDSLLVTIKVFLHFQIFLSCRLSIASHKTPVCTKPAWWHIQKITLYIQFTYIAVYVCFMFLMGSIWFWKQDKWC